MEVPAFPASSGAAVPRGGILLAHAAAERKEKLYKKTLPQQELGFFVVFFFLFPPFAHFFAFVASPRKGKKIKGEKKKKIRLPAGRKSYSRNYFLLVSLCLGFHNPGDLCVPLVIRALRSHALRLEKHRQSFPAGKNTPGVGEDGWGAKILWDGLGEGCRLECPCSVGRSCWSYRGAGGQDWDLESLEPCGQHLSAP